MITIDLPSTSPMIQPAAWAPLAPKLDAASAAVPRAALAGSEPVQKTKGFNKLRKCVLRD
jgi:hypothetical protein